MKLTILVPVFALLSTVFANSEVSKRDARTILNDITNINNKAQTLKNTIDSFPGGPLSAIQALGVQSAATDLDNAIKTATTDANNSNSLSSSDSATVANSVTQLQPLIYATLNALIAKKSGFSTAVLGLPATSLVKNSLTSLRQDTAAFGAAVISKLIPVLQMSAPLVTSDIDFRFERAIEAFSS